MKNVNSCIFVSTKLFSGTFRYGCEGIVARPMVLTVLQALRGSANNGLRFLDKTEFRSYKKNDALLSSRTIGA